MSLIDKKTSFLINCDLFSRVFPRLALAACISHSDRFIVLPGCASVVICQSKYIGFGFISFN